MKKALKFAGLAALVLALVGFILMMATHVIAFKADNSAGWYAGTAAIFGSGKASATVLGVTVVDDWSGNLAWSALLAWIFGLVAMIILCMGVVLPLLKVKALDKFAGLLNLIAVGLLVVGGVFVFLSKGALAAANDWDLGSDWHLGVGWIFAGILFILGGLVALAPAAVDFMGKKK